MVRRLRAGLTGYVLIAPAVLATVVFFLVPMVVSGYWSLTDYNGVKPPIWVGLDNYVDLLTDPRFQRSLRNTVFFVVMGMAIGPMLGLASAVALNRLGAPPGALPDRLLPAHDGRRSWPWSRRLEDALPENRA